MGRGGFGGPSGARLYVHYEGAERVDISETEHTSTVKHGWIAVAEGDFVPSEDEADLSVKEAVKELRTPICTRNPTSAVWGSTELVLGGEVFGSPYPGFKRGKWAVAVDLERGVGSSNPCWRELPSMLATRVRPRTVVIGCKLYVFGGRPTSALGELQFPDEPAAEIYDLQANTWTGMEDIPKRLATGRVYGCFSWHNGTKIAVVADAKGGTFYLWIYDLVRHRWSWRQAFLALGSRCSFGPDDFVFAPETDTLFIVWNDEWFPYNMHMHGYEVVAPIQGVEQTMCHLPGTIPCAGYMFSMFFFGGEENCGTAAWEFGLLWMDLKQRNTLHFAKVLVESCGKNYFGKFIFFGACRMLGPEAAFPRGLLVKCQPQLSLCKTMPLSPTEQRGSRRVITRIDRDCKLAENCPTLIVIFWSCFSLAAMLWIVGVI